VLAPPLAGLRKTPFDTAVSEELNGVVDPETVWSYSRLTSFDDCKYRWFLQYVLKKKRGEPQFFSTFGTFIHEILEKYLSGKLEKDELVQYFLENYDENVVGEAPTERIANNFFESALSYLKSVDFPFKSIVATEKKVNFKIGDYKFVGYIDVLATKGKRYHIVDHKSHGLRHRSGRRFQTAYDKELDQYLRQQYLYSIPIYDEYGQYPKTLNFNCYRHGRFISEPFDYTRLEETKDWAVAQIEKIRREHDWDANPDAFKCNYICDMRDHCPYRAQYKSRGGRR